MTPPPVNLLERILAFGVLVGAVAVVGYALAVVIVYARARRPGDDGLLVWHVCGVAVATVVIFAGLVLATLDILGLTSTPRPVRLGIYLASTVLFLIALHLIASTSRRRIQPAAAAGRPAVADRAGTVPGRDRSRRRAPRRITDHPGADDPGRDQ